MHCYAEVRTVIEMVTKILQEHYKTKGRSTMNRDISLVSGQIIEENAFFVIK
jgi:hypothetical protein